jgi:hypothetical protein
MESLDYQGKIKIFIKFLSPKTSIKMHSASPVEIISITDNEGSILNFESRPFELIQIFLLKQTSDESFIQIDFKAQVGTKYQGCYVSRSTDKLTLKEKTMVITHFEPTFARLALPCFDEPMFKSTFDLAIKADDWQVISNMRGEKDEKTGKIKFDRSPLMSIYLLHWSICRHQRISAMAGETEVSVLTDYPEDSRFSLEIAKDCLEFYNQEFLIPYPLPKIDLIAVYSKSYTEMSVRAMENWGSITFAENILYRFFNDDFNKTFRDCRTIAHEISHMWFGNLVTMNWWTDLWLNEGFARFMEFKCLQKIRPEFNPWERFTSEVLYQALLIDNPVSRSHPVEIDNIQADNINTFFDSISYLKGASILRMLEDVMGNSFSKAVNNYLSDYKWKNVDSDQFFESMQKFTETNVKDMMKSWTRQSGYPLIECMKQENKTFSLIQSAFDPNHSARWVIPLRYLTSTGETGLFILSEEVDQLPFSADWVKLNYGATGFYRVLYKKCPELLSSVKNFTALDRYGLLHDYCSFYKEHIIDVESLLSVIEALIPENKYFICTLMYSLSFNYESKKVQERLDQILVRNSFALMNSFGLSLASRNSELGLLQELYIQNIIEYWRIIQEKRNLNELESGNNSEIDGKNEDDEELRNIHKFAKLMFVECNDSSFLCEVLHQVLIEEKNQIDELFESLNDAITQRALKLTEGDEFMILLIGWLCSESGSSFSVKIVDLLKHFFYLKQGQDVEYLKNQLKVKAENQKNPQVLELIAELINSSS